MRKAEGKRENRAGLMQAERKERSCIIFTRSAVTYKGHCRVVPPHNSRKAPGIPHPAAHTSQKLPHRPATAGFSVGLPNSACSGVSWAPGWEKTAGAQSWGWQERDRETASSSLGCIRH